uniref:Sphingomyelin synthase-like domain-containing protein n=1 Tax=Chrysotila carterae TaxID=13221 RepID=A0A7S4C271_CHRCT|mmetsp:Transcript_24450/g.51193  ORF Transcript_24450/g.51193 Transcript_24450/m.51193 type:complete len:355 (-) Transcript_24450:380-1444(-)
MSSMLSLRAAPFIGWMAVLALAASLAGLCGYPSLNLRKSTASCSLLKGCDASVPSNTSGTCCVTLPELCAPTSTAALLSPKWLAYLAGSGGPLITWLPLVCGAASLPDIWKPLRPSLLWYLALIGPVRHTHRILPSSWDPSGHVFVYGMQLIPWLASARLGVGVTLWLRAWSICLVFLSATTAAFFHTPSETAAGLLLLLPLWGFLMRRQGMELDVQNLMSDTASSHEECSLLSGARRWFPHEDQSLSSPGRVASTTFAAVLWIVVAVAVWSTASSREMPQLAGEAGYDIVLWLLLAFVESRAAALCERRLQRRQRDAAGSMRAASSSEATIACPHEGNCVMRARGANVGSGGD